MTTPAEILSTQLSRLTPEQSGAVAAICTPPEGVRVVRLLAGAGSGKTRVVVLAAAQLVLSDFAGTILVTTFTRKAREEITKRLEQILTPVQAARVTVATFNKLALSWIGRNRSEIVRREPGRYVHQFDDGHKIDGPSKLPIRMATLASRIFGRPKRQGKKPNRVKLPIPGLEDTGFFGLALNGDPEDNIPAVVDEYTTAGDYLQAVDLIRLRGWRLGTPEANRALAVLAGKARIPEEGGPLERDWFQWLNENFGAYPRIDAFAQWVQRAVENLRAWDFIESIDAYNRYNRDGFTRGIVDEAQDNNYLNLMSAIGLAERADGVVTCVGDVRQSIFSFQGATPGFMRNIGEVYPTATVELTNNFRSKRQIVMLGNAVAAGQSWMVGAASYPARLVNGQMAPGELTLLTGGDEAVAVEAIVQKIAERVAAGSPYRDHTVLYRSHAVGDLVEMMALRAGIPVIRIGAKRSFFDGIAAKKILAYLYVSIATLLEPSIPHILTVCFGEEHAKRFLSPQMVEELLRRMVATGHTELLGGLNAALMQAQRTARNEGSRSAEAFARNFETLVTDIVRLRNLPWTDPKNKTVLSQIEDYLIPPKSQDVDLDALDDPEDDDEVGRLVLAMSTFKWMAKGTESIRDFYEFVKLLRNPPKELAPQRVTGQDDPDFCANYDARDRVTLGTIFAAKGLEWPHVYAISQAGSWPSTRNDPDEERRLFYVAVTRAEDSFTLAVPTLRGEKPIPVSPFGVLMGEYMQRDAREVEVAEAGQALGWLLTDVQRAIADRRVIWTSPVDASVTVDLNLDTYGVVEHGADGDIVVAPRLYPNGEAHMLDWGIVDASIGGVYAITRVNRASFRAPHTAAVAVRTLLGLLSPTPPKGTSVERDVFEAVQALPGALNLGLLQHAENGWSVVITESDLAHLRIEIPGTYQLSGQPRMGTVDVVTTTFPQAIRANTTRDTLGRYLRDRAHLPAHVPTPDAPPEPAPPALPAYTEEVQQRIDAFAEWLVGHDPALREWFDEALREGWIDITAARATSAAVSRRLGWADAGDIMRLLRACSPYAIPTDGTGPYPAVRSAGGVTAFKVAEDRVTMIGDVPVDPAGPTARWGLLNHLSGPNQSIAWEGEPATTFPVDAPVYTESDPAAWRHARNVAYLRALASGDEPATRIPSSRDLQAVTMGSVVVEEQPAGSGQYIMRLINEATPITQGPRRDRLLEDARQFDSYHRRVSADRGAQLPQGAPAFGGGSIYAVDVFRGAEATTHHVIAGSPTLAIAKQVRETHGVDRWAWYAWALARIERSGATDADEVYVYVDVPGIEYRSRYLEPAPEVVETPTTITAVIPRPWVPGPLPPGDYRAVIDVIDGTPVYEVIRRDKMQLRSGLLLFRDSDNPHGVRTTALLRVDLTGDSFALTPITSFVPPRVIGDGREADERRAAFYTEVAATLRRVRAADALTARGVGDLTLSERILLRAMFELGPDGVFRLSASGSVLLPTGVPLHRTGNGGIGMGNALQRFVDLGYLVAVGSGVGAAYTWGF